MTKKPISFIRIWRVWLVILLLGSTNVVLAQISDSTRFEVNMGGVTSTNDFLPFYLKNNRNGKVDEGTPFFVDINSSYQKTILRDFQIEGNLALRNDRVYEFNAELRWKKLSLFAGRKPIVFGGKINNELTTGGMVISNNALPIPQIGFFLNDYLNVPFTHEFLKVRGGISHGWFEEDRYISRPFLHLKQLKFMVDLRSLIGLRIYSSLIHAAQWGGTSPDGTTQPNEFKDFERVFLGRGIPNPFSGGAIGEANALGNHLGATEWTINQIFGEYELSLIYQKPFEDAGSLIYLAFTDYMMGFELKLPQRSVFKKIYVEYLQTKRQGGPGLPDPTPQYPTVDANFQKEFGGRDDYYNNYLYRSGWTYNGQVISNPLYSTYSEARKYLGEFNSYEAIIVNNRIKSWHLGASIEPMERLSLTIMLTRSINFGAYAGLYEGRFNWGGAAQDPNFDYVYGEGKVQYYTGLKANWAGFLNNSPFGLQLILGYDTGELYSNLGAELSFNYSLLNY